MSKFRVWTGLWAGILVVAGTVAAVAQGLPNILLPDTPSHQVSPHVWALKAYPNIFFVVGDKGVLAVDTGVGPRNGEVVAREARRLGAKGQKLYLTTTHFHAEHAAGDGGFPAGTTVIRPAVQQAELDSEGQRMMDLFSSRSPEMKALLAGVPIRKAQVLYDRDHVLDLGGVKVRLMWRGPAHTRGDQLIFVEGDQALISGDVVQDKASPNITCQECSPRKWIAVIDQIAPLKPRLVLPTHTQAGDGALVAQQRAFLADLQSRAMALKAQGKSAEEAGKLILAEFQTKYPGWTGLQGLPAAVKKAYDDAG
jgi:glyoxylase-like metal-dependent hydrolase (beta-lactamase superfamily II)